MNLKEILPNLVEIFYLSNKINGDLEFSKNSLEIDNKNISGQLLQYYQHLIFKDDCYFGEQFFGMVLFSAQSKSREIVTWGLEDNPEWKNSYIIFAQNTSDDIIFCDVSYVYCPVYGMISGSKNYHKLGDSLFEFLSFYIELANLEIIKFHREIYSDNNFNIKQEFINDVTTLINNNVCGESHDGLIKFLLDGL